MHDVFVSTCVPKAKVIKRLVSPDENKTLNWFPPVTDRAILSYMIL